MKYFCSLILMTTLILLATTARAQSYRPFRFGLSYQLSAGTAPGDTTHLLRLASRQLQGSDSLFLFDKRTSRATTRPLNCGDYVRRTDNLFGASLRIRPGSEYVLTAGSGRTFTLRPRQALGQLWVATAAGLTATVSARTLGSVLGQADSLATITLSDGAVLIISKRFGWVSGPPLGSYLNGRLPRAPLTLTALPELGLGIRRFGAFVVYDFQPGDVFLRKTDSYGGGAPCVEIWTRDSVLSRSPGRTADTLVYRIARRSLTRSCSRSSSTLGAASVETLRITPATDHLDQVTGFWEQSATAAVVGLVHLPAWRTASYNQRPVQRHLQYMICVTAGDSTSLRDASNLDFGYYVSTAPGLGQTQVQSLSFSTQITTLVGYRKGPESWGQLPPFAQLLPTHNSRPASTTTAFPNPFGAALAVAFSLARPQPVNLALCDALGRVVLENAAVPLTAGVRQLTLATAGLPAGVYTLHLRFAQDGRTEVLRVLKAQ